MPDPAAEALCQELEAALERIKHCVDQLSDEEVWHRPRADLNAAGNLLLHLAGNVRYFVVHGVGGAPDVRDRPAEFAARGPSPSKAELLDRLAGTVAEATAVLRAASPEELARVGHIHDTDTTGYGAAVRCVAHFRGHTQELIHMTRTLRGDGYRFAGRR